MANIWNAGQLATNIKQLAQNDVPDLGNDAAQNSFIFAYMNMIMWELAKTAGLTTYSDPLAISSNGYVTFLKNSQSIENSIFEPRTVLTSTESEVLKRSSYSAPTGWYRESHDLPIHVRGLTAGTYVLKYWRYPATVTLASDPIEFASSANATICKEVVALIKLSKNSYAGFQVLDAAAKQGLGNAAQGAISAMGTGSSGQPVGPADVAIQRGS